MKKLILMALAGGVIMLNPGALLRADAAKEDLAKKEYAAFEGTWKIVSMESEGKLQPDTFFKTSRLILKRNQFTMKDPAATYKGDFQVDPGKNPKHITIHFTAGPEKGKSIEGIYELKGDTYKLCIGMGDKKRPAAFTSKDGYIIEVLKRVKE